MKSALQVAEADDVPFRHPKWSISPGLLRSLGFRNDSMCPRPRFALGLPDCHGKLKLEGGRLDTNITLSIVGFCVSSFGADGADHVFQTG
jgi:hypothetical protein